MTPIQLLLNTYGEIHFIFNSWVLQGRNSTPLPKTGQEDQLRKSSNYLTLRSVSGDMQEPCIQMSLDGWQGRRERALGPCPSPLSRALPWRIDGLLFFVSLVWHFFPNHNPLHNGENMQKGLAQKEFRTIELCRQRDSLSKRWGLIMPRMRML